MTNARAEVEDHGRLWYKFELAAHNSSNTQPELLHWAYVSWNISLSCICLSILFIFVQ